jgi:hypothetical protein
MKLCCKDCGVEIRPASYRDESPSEYAARKRMFYDTYGGRCSLHFIEKRSKDSVNAMRRHIERQNKSCTPAPDRR